MATWTPGLAKYQSTEWLKSLNTSGRVEVGLPIKTNLGKETVLPLHPKNKPCCGRSRASSGRNCLTAAGQELYGTDTPRGTSLKIGHQNGAGVSAPRGGCCNHQSRISSSLTEVAAQRVKPASNASIEWQLKATIGHGLTASTSASMRKRPTGLNSK